jgi:coenzyme F420-reducing hydrogenase gamma subunit
VKPRIAVHKFASCDGCQLAFLTAGEALLDLAGLVDIVHFAEAGPVSPDAEVDIAFIEGSVSTPQDIDRIQRVRANSRCLVSIGVCATAGGIQALRNLGDGDDWVASLYASPEYIRSLATSDAVSRHVKVDLELWGCPVNSRQLLAAVRALLSGVTPPVDQEKVCAECKRSGAVCVMVARGVPCMGPVTRTGCGAVCPRFGRGCYACFGPSENINSDALGGWMRGLGLAPEGVARRFRFINAEAAEFRAAADKAADSGK